MFARATQGAPNPSGVSLNPEKYLRFTDAVVTRKRKVEAPEPTRPAAGFASIHEARGRFLARREQALSFVRECTSDLRNLFAMHPLLGQIDCYQYFLLLALHPARHAVQIEEIKSDPGFPEF